MTKGSMNTRQESVSLKPLPPICEAAGRELTVALAGKGSYVIDLKKMEVAAGILCSRGHNNIVVTGKAGTGKTAFVEAFAREVCRDTYPGLSGRRIAIISLDALFKDAHSDSSRGVTIKNLFEEAKRCRIILFFDEGHRICDSSAPNSIANIMKPFLTDGEIQVIIATTIEEYRKFIEPETALNRRFENITIDEPDFEATVKILKSTAAAYYPDKTFTNNTLEIIAEASGRFWAQRNEPDRSLSLLDYICGQIAAKGLGKIVDKNIVAKLLAARFSVSEEAVISNTIERIRLLPEKLGEKLRFWKSTKTLIKTMQDALLRPMNTEGPLCKAVLAGDDGELLQWIASETAALMGFDPPKEQVTADLSQSSLRHSHFGSHSDALIEPFLKNPHRAIIFKWAEASLIDAGTLGKLSNIARQGKLIDQDGREADYSGAPLFVIYKAKASEEKTMGFGENRKADVKLSADQENCLQNILGEGTRIIFFNNLTAIPEKMAELDLFSSRLNEKARSLHLNCSFETDKSAVQYFAALMLNELGFSKSSQEIAALLKTASAAGLTGRCVVTVREGRLVAEPCTEQQYEI